MQRFDRLLLLLPGWLGFMLYLPALSHGFVWDDNYFLIDMPYLRDPALWWQQVSEPLFVSRNYFRPLPLLSFVVEARLGGLDPFVFHFTNLLLHAANTTMVVLLARAVVPAATVAAAVAGLLFAVHPALIEGVAWISDRFDLMMVFFVLLALVCDRRLSRPLARAAAVGSCFVLALLCKESAVVLLVLLPLWQAVHRVGDVNWRPWQRDAWAVGDRTTWLALLLAFVCYLALRHGGLGYLYSSDTPMASGGGLQHLLLIGKTFGWYLVLTLWPFGQILPVHPAATPIAIDDMGAWLGLATIVTTFAGLVFLLLRRPLARRAALGGTMAVVALAPVLNLVPLTIGDNLVHDRFLMLPLACLALPLMLTVQGRGKFVGVAVGAWMAAAVVTVVSVVPRWESDLTLWQWAYSQQPGSEIASQNYVAALVTAGRTEETIAIARSTLRLMPNVPSVVHNLAMALNRLGQHDESERLVHQAIGLLEARDGNDLAKSGKARMDLSATYNLLGLIHIEQNRRDEAEQALHQSIALSPQFPIPHFNLAKLLYERADWAGGDAELALAVRFSTAGMAAVRQRLGDEKKRQMQAAPGQPKAAG